MTRDFVLDWIEQRLTPGAKAAPRRALEDDLGELQPLLMSAAVLSPPFDADVLARTLDLDRRRLTGSLTKAVARGFLTPASGSRFAFSDRELARRAYDAIPDDARATLHRRAAEALTDSQPHPAISSAIARHFELACDWKQAVLWHRAAAKRACDLGRRAAAVDHLHRALELCGRDGLHPSPREELKILGMLGPLLSQRDGSGATAVFAIYARCLEIVDAFAAKEVAGDFEARWGLAACILVQGRVDTALELCRRLLVSSERDGNVTRQLLAFRLHGLARLMAGEIDGAISDLDEACQRYDFGRDAALRHRYASDQLALALAHKAWAQAIAGRIEQSDATSELALEHADRVQHAHTSAHVSCVLAGRAQVLGRRGETASMAIGGAWLAQQHGFPYWSAWADILLGWREAGSNRAQGLARLDRGVVAYRKTGAGQILSYAMLLRGGMALDGGGRDEALAAAEAGLAAARDHGVRLFESDLIRLKALAIGGSFGGMLMTDAAKLAQRQGALLFQRRIVTASIAMSSLGGK